MTTGPNTKTATERAVSLFEANGGILNTKKAIKLGIHSRTLYALRDEARLERMERGLYRLAAATPLGNSDFVTVALKVPRGVICLISALAFHRMTTQVPHAVYLAIGANDQAPALRYPPASPLLVFQSDSRERHQRDEDGRYDCPHLFSGEDAGRLLQVPQQDWD